MLAIAIHMLSLLLLKRVEFLPWAEMIPIPEVKQFGAVVKPATEMTEKDYDIGNWKEQIQKLVMGAGVLGFIYYKWGYLTPLVLQVFMTPAQVIESELFSIHLQLPLLS